jgi:hypothetical protein
MKRAVAVLVAVGLVAGAVLVRRALTDDGASAGKDLELVCGSELAAACSGFAGADGIRVVVEDEAVTAGRLVEGELVLDRAVWLAAAPWPAMAAAGADSQGVELPDLAGSTVLGESPAVIVARTDRMEAITAACGTPTWACIGEQAGGPWTALGGETAWGRVEVALPDAGTGAGAVAINQGVASRIGRTDFAINDLDDEPADAAWFDRLASESSANQRDDLTPLQQFLRVPGSLGVVGSLGAEADTELTGVSNAEAFETVVPEPSSTAQVRLWAADPDALADAIERLDPARLSTLLSDSGWEATGAATSTGPGTMVSDDRGPYPDAGLPNAGVMSAVITRWENVR